MAERLLERAMSDTAESNLNTAAFADLKVGAWPVVLCADVGTVDEAFVTTTVDRLPSEAGGRLNCLLIPAAVEGVEAEAIARWRRV